MQNMRELTRREIGITAFVCRVTDGRVELPQPVIDYFDVPGIRLCVKVQKEVLLACETTKTSVPAVLRQGQLVLPEAAVEKLKVVDGDCVAMIERRNAFAFKRIPSDLLREFERVPAGPQDRPVPVSQLSRTKARPKAKRTARPSVSPKPGAIAQVIAIEPLRSGNRISLKKPVRSYLGKEQVLCWTCDGEVCLTARTTDRPAEIRGSGVVVPPDALAKLDAAKGDQIAFVERSGGAALKKMIVEERPAVEAMAQDCESAYRIVRTVETNAMPDKLLPVLAERYRTRALQHDVIAFLSGRRSIEAWLARKLLGRQDGDDDPLRQSLVEERLVKQAENGSWGSDTMLTARSLRELSGLGMTRRSAAIRRGAEWLLSQDESEANPGMFFLSDRLVARQAEILTKRKAAREGSGKRTLGSLRFAGRTPSEAGRVLAADTLIERSCGTRIMWPNAISLEALLGLGYEKHPRVQRAITSLLQGYTYWCECNYQLGVGTHSRRRIPGEAELAAREDELMAVYRFAGASGLDGYLTRRREAELPGKGGQMYRLPMPNHIQPCEVITVRGVHEVKNPLLHRAAGALLRRFAGVQQPGDGAFPAREYNPSQAHMLRVFSCYDYPVARVAIMRAIPWIVDNQNSDGCWGEGDSKDASTLAVVRSLVRIRSCSPQGMQP